MADAVNNGQSTWSDLGQQLWGGVRQGLYGMDRMVNAGLGGPGINAPAPQVPQAKDFAGRTANTVGQFASTLPFAALGAESLPAAGAQVLRQIIPTIASGIGSQAAQDAVSPAWKPYASLGGALVGGGLASAGQEAVGGLTSAAGNVMGRLGLAPKQNIGGVNVTGAQAQGAANQVREALGPAGEATITNPLADLQKRLTITSDPAKQQELRDRIQAMQQATASGGSQYETVPGSMPTTAQVVPTPSALALEKAHRVATPEPFIAREQAQNTARLNAIENVAPTGNPAAVGEYLVQQLDQAQNQGNQFTNTALGRLQAAIEKLGGPQSTEAVGNQIRGALQSEAGPSKAAVSQLYQQVDPDGTWALPAGPLQKAGASLLDEMSPTAQIDSQEMALLQRAASAPSVVPFRDLGQMRADTNAAMARLSGTPGYAPNVRRLTVLKNGIDQTIADGAAARAEAENAAVQAGQMSPEQRMMNALLAMKANENAAGNSISDVGARFGGGEGAGTGATGASPMAAGSSGAAMQGGRQAGRASGTAGLPPGAQPLEPNFSQEAATRYQEATAARAAHGARFNRGGVGDVLQRGSNYEPYAVQAGDVPKAIFTGNANEPEEIRQLVRAVGEKRAGELAAAAFANDLRNKGIIKQDGLIDGPRYATWLNKRDASLKEIPDVRKQFISPASAQATYDTITAKLKAARAEFDRSAAAKFIKDDPQVAVGKAFSSGNPTEALASLVRAVHGGPDKMGPITAAEAGLRRGVVDYILEKARSTTPAGETQDFMKAGNFRVWIRKNAVPLKALFGGQGVQNLEAVAADLRRQAYKTTATAGPDTAQKFFAAQKYGLKEHGMHATPLMILGEMLGRVVEHATGGEGMLGDIAGVAAGAGGYMLHAMRQAGIRTTNDLVREAMLHPSVAKELLTKVPASGKIGAIAARRIAVSLRQATLDEANLEIGQQNQ